MFQSIRVALLRQRWSDLRLFPSRSGCSLPTLVAARTMAGHAKWQNVKHTKLAKDHEKARRCDKYARMVRAAVRESGPDPKLNSWLRNILDEAHKYNVPMSSLENSMKKASSGKVKLGFLEIARPGGCYVVVDYETENVCDMRYQIKLLLRKYGGSIQNVEGRWRGCFERKGILRVVKIEDSEALDAEKALDHAILAGAEDVQLRTDDEEEGGQYLEFFCDPNELHAVNKQLQLSGCRVEEAYVGFVPNSLVQLPPEEAVVAENFFADLSDMSDIVRVYENTL